MEHFLIIVNGFQPFTIARKNSILDVTPVLDPPLLMHEKHAIYQTLQNSQLFQSNTQNINDDNDDDNNNNNNNSNNNNNNNNNISNNNNNNSNNK